MQAISEIEFDFSFNENMTALTVPSEPEYDEPSSTDDESQGRLSGIRFFGFIFLFLLNIFTNRSLLLVRCVFG